MSIKTPEISSQDVSSHISVLTQPFEEVQPVQTTSVVHAEGVQSASTSTPGQISENPATSQSFGGAISQPSLPYEQHVPPKKSGTSFVAGFLGAALALCLGLVGLYAYQHFFSTSKVNTNEIPVINVDGEDVTLASVVASVALPSVVSIDVYEQSSGMSSFFGEEAPGNDSGYDDSTYTQVALGSGVVVTEDGYIITNNHVVEGSDLLVATINGQEYDATFIGADESSDIAVLKIDSENETFSPIVIGSSADIQIGDWVMSLGNPFGLENSVSVGIVSALQRSSTLVDSETGNTVIYPNMIQTDAVINPGNSGGPLVNQKGELIGINSMISSYSGSSSGVGFAIPIDYAYSIAQSIMEGKTPTHAQLGVSLQSIDSYMMNEYGLNDNSGAYVAEVYENTAADEAGMKRGDVIIKIDGSAIESPEDVQSAVRSYSPGTEIVVTVIRDENERDIKVTLKSDEQKIGEEQGSNGEDSSQWGYKEEDRDGPDTDGDSLRDFFDLFR
ncbi:MAG: trypsin-like peptidase domain-containing protein [Eggerthellaceae bacterium]|nr:trypsin-like peptidase domain-containing protein [Eggerthellaceae bacterium]